MLLILTQSLGIWSRNKRIDFNSLSFYSFRPNLKKTLSLILKILSKEKIIAALGYTPADNATFYEDESGKLVISDEKGYIIAKIDEEGLQTTTLSANAIKLNDEDLSVKL